MSAVLRLARLAVPACRPSVVRRVQAQRNLVSPTLLTRTWENESIASLRQEARQRGLSAKGPKANLILRITQHDAQNAHMQPPIPKSPPKPTPTTTPPTIDSGPANLRSVSSNASKAASHTISPGPGVPPSAVTSTPPPPYEIFNVVIPDLSQPPPEPPVRVPYVPDFWSSEPVSEPVPEEEDLSKMLVIGGVSTQLGDGPTYNLERISEGEEEPEPPSTTAASESTSTHSAQQSGLLRDITEDLGLPPLSELKKTYWKILF